MNRYLNAHLSYENGIPVLSLEGYLTSKAEGLVLETYKKIPETHSSRVILDFDKTEYINSSGVSILVQLLKYTKDKKIKIEFACPNAHLQRVFDIIGLTDFVPIHNTLSDAIE